MVPSSNPLGHVHESPTVTEQSDSRAAVGCGKGNAIATFVADTGGGSGAGAQSQGVLDIVVPAWQQVAVPSEQAGAQQLVADSQTVAEQALFVMTSTCGPP